MIGREGGYTTIELLIVMAILGVVLGGIVALFTAGINADAAQNQRFQSQQDVQLAMTKLRKDVHSACTISAPATYNTPVSSVTFYYASDSCGSGTHSITWCTAGSGSRYALYRIVATTCTSPTAKFADFLTGGAVFDYLPPNAHLVTSTSLGLGTSTSYIVTQDGSAILPRLHVDLSVLRGSTRGHTYRLFDDIALRNGARACGAGVASC